VRRFNTHPFLGWTLSDHIRINMRDWLQSFAPVNANVLLLSADVASWFDLLGDFKPIQHDAHVNTTDHSIKIGTWKRFDVYVERGQTTGFGAFMWGLDCNMDAAFELFESSITLVRFAPEV
jgi:hypothetical protein